MALGPELVFVQARDIYDEFARNHVRRVDARDLWLSLSFSRDRVLLFSWNAENYGVCSVSPHEIRALSDASSARPPISDAVKSHIVGAELTGAVSLNRDRILRIGFRRAIGAGFFQSRYLLFEASGRYSNIMILDEDYVVIEAAKHIYPDSNRYRSIIPGSRYTPPPSVGRVALDDFDPLSEDALEAASSVRGAGKPLISAIKAHCAGDMRNMNVILGGLDFFKTCEGRAIFQVIENYVTLYPILLGGAKALDVSNSLDAARITVTAPLLDGRVRSAKRKISSRLEEMSRANEKRIGEYERLCSDEGEIARLKLHGSLILANAWAIPPRSAEVVLSEWTEDGETPHKITLDPKRDASQNAEALFAKYKRKKSALARIRALLPSLYLKRDELSEQSALLECHTDISTIFMMLEEIAPESAHMPKPKHGRESSAAAPPHKRFEFPWANAVIFCGLSAKGNHYVAFRLARGEDIWLHVKDMPGAHVILHFNSKPDCNDDQYAQMLDIAASCAVYHSKGRDGGRVGVDYTERKHVRAIPGGGMGHVTYKEFRTISADASSWLEAIGDWTKE
ncbi:MAG: NFACT family protein [Synergistaceae bacterium]|jgi:predicted ribosome quality control (RQC) complex YloA/Tae2 family protein|nr:NFACT family protein [Synergistaceae bacterium]